MAHSIRARVVLVLFSVCFFFVYNKMVQYFNVSSKRTWYYMCLLRVHAVLIVSFFCFLVLPRLGPSHVYFSGHGSVWRQHMTICNNNNNVTNVTHHLKWATSIFYVHCISYFVMRRRCLVVSARPHHNIHFYACLVALVIIWRSHVFCMGKNKSSKRISMHINQFISNNIFDGGDGRRRRWRRTDVASN